MGALFSKAKAPEDKAINTYEKLEVKIKACNAKKRAQRLIITISRVILLISFIFVIIAAILGYNFKDIKMRFIISLCIIVYSCFRFLAISIITSNIKSLEEEIVKLKSKFVKYFNMYVNSPDFNHAKKILEKSNEYHNIDINLLMNFDFQSIYDITKHKFFKRFIQFVTNNGPDFRYAVICPVCHSYNGTVDPSQKDTLQYVCTYCQCKVSMTEMIEGPKKEENVHDVEVDDQGKIDALSDSDDDLNDL